MNANEEMKVMGMLHVMCECHVYVPEEQQEMIRDAVEDNLPKHWGAKRTLQRLELVVLETDLEQPNKQEELENAK